MKFLPTLRPLALLGLAISFAACSTPENRRELYNSTEGNGPWHDYARRMDAAEETGVAPGDMGHPAGMPAPAMVGDGNNTTGTTVVRGGRPTRQPKSAPVMPDPTVLPSSQTAPAGVPAPVGVPSSPTTTDPASPAAPGGATTVPPSDPTTVPVNPPTT